MAAPNVALVVATVVVVLLGAPGGGRSGSGLLGRVSAAVHRVGAKRQWAPGVNYTEWTQGRHFYLNDWLEFDYQKIMYDVLQVNETSFNLCLNANPIRNDSKGRSYVVNLNRTGWWYFICSKGYCWGGMKLAVNVEPLPSPSPSPTTNITTTSSSASRLAKPLFPMRLLLSARSSEEESGSGWRGILWSSCLFGAWATCLWSVLFGVWW